MAHHDELFEQGRQADRAGRVAEAALLYRSAAATALKFGDRTAWFKSLVQASVSTLDNGDIRGGLALLLEARQSEPEDAPELEAWLARKELFTITISTRPERSRLEQLLTDLQTYATIHRNRANHVLILKEQLSSCCGDWRTALACCETAFQDDIFKAYSAYLAAAHCLRLGQLSACRDWISALDQCDDPWVPRWSAESTLLLAFAEGRSFATLLSHLRTYTDRAAYVQRADTAGIARDLTTRAHLLDPNAGDPAADFHASRAELRQQPRNKQIIHGRYETHLLYLDYRLACLRYAANVPAVDDLYYYQPQQVPLRLTPANPDQFQLRLHKARAAAQSTLRSARHLDNLLGCDWRQCEIRTRSERIEEIALAFG